MLKFLQEQDTQSNPIQRRINQLVEVQQIREEVFNKAHIFQDKAIFFFDRNTKPNDFQQSNLVLKWDARHEYKGKDSNFDHLWKGPYQIVEVQENNTYVLHKASGDFLIVGLVNSHFLKHYLTQ